MLNRCFLLIISLIIALASLESCSVFNSMVGANLDSERFDEARKAKIIETEAKAAEKLLTRMQKGDNIENADISFYLSEDFLMKIINQYNGSHGWIDSRTSYEINRITLKLQNGSALVSLFMTAQSEQFSVDLKLVMDCLLTFEMDSNNLYVKMEPFNIAPDVQATGFLVIAQSTLTNLIKINLAQISQKFPPIKIPVNFQNNFNIQNTVMNIRDKVNMRIEVPKRSINFNLKLKEVLIFNKSVFVALNIDKTEVK